MMRNQILIGDVRRRLREIPPNSVDTIVTSPPYFRLRNYQRPDQIGLEASIDGYVAELRVVARGLRRVLKPSGSMWLNLGDTFSTSTAQGANRKSLLLAPERVALALITDGWHLRNKVIWAKSNPMPSSVRDRLSCTYEVIYFLTKSAHYFFDLDAIRVPHAGRQTRARPPRVEWSVPDEWRGPSTGTNSGLDRLKAAGISGHPRGKNPGDVWTLPTAGYRGAHHAVFPQSLVERPLRATCPESVCRSCGVPWSPNHSPQRSCDCAENAGWVPGVVLDPFMGAGTTAVVAEQLRRHWIGIELNPVFAAQAMQRIQHHRAAPGSDEARPGANAA